MLLSQLTEFAGAMKISGDTGVEISSLTCDSRRVVPGTLFFALPGAVTDGHSFIDRAVEAGASAVVLEREDRAPASVPWVKVADARHAMALMAARFNGQPTADRPLIGITGTNGKTTTSYIIEGILKECGIASAVLGTISYRFGDMVVAASHTTPESTELQEAFRKMADAGAGAFVMEVSSHALEQKRVDGSMFDLGVFTNLTRDHLDYHQTMERYRDAKMRLFRELLIPDSVKPVRRAVINLDDEYGGEFAAATSCPVVTYGLKDGADVTARALELTLGGISGQLVTPVGEIAFRSALLGRYNLSNILAAAAAGVAMGLPLEAVSRGITSHLTVPGRLERVHNDRGVICLVDYAHTGDALKNVLETLGEIASGRIITVFGCGGDRDQGKRPVMGRLAGELSNLAVVTSDNPRTEAPDEIIRQVLAGLIPLRLRQYSVMDLEDGFSEKGFVSVENRREAIRLAARLARPGDILLLAGKGHEDYQITGKVKQHFDDREEAAAALKGDALCSR